jgi:hypothetical protein
VTMRKIVLALGLSALLASPDAMLAQTAAATMPGLWPEQPLPPAKEELRNAVIVLRDSLRAVLATSERIDRAHASGSSAVLRSAGRTLTADCSRASRGAAALQEKIKGFSTSDPRGDEVLERYRRAILALEQAMAACNSDVASALSPEVDGAKLTAVGTRNRKAMDAYEGSVQEVMKTLSIRFDPKGHKSAINM